MKPKLRTDAPLACASRSMTTTRIPLSAAARAHDRPTIPAPTTARSNTPDRLATVTNPCVAQRVLERAEPRLVVLPLVESVAVNRLAHLLRTRRADAALGLVKFDARGLELEAA